MSFEDELDAVDALRDASGRDLDGARIRVNAARGPPTLPDRGGFHGGPGRGRWATGSFKELLEALLKAPLIDTFSGGGRWPDQWLSVVAPCAAASNGRRPHLAASASWLEPSQASQHARILSYFLGTYWVADLIMCRRTMG